VNKKRGKRGIQTGRQKNKRIAVKYFHNPGANIQPEKEKKPSRKGDFSTPLGSFKGKARTSWGVAKSLSEPDVLLKKERRTKGAVPALEGALEVARESCILERRRCSRKEGEGKVGGRSRTYS